MGVKRRLPRTVRGLIASCLTLICGCDPAPIVISLSQDVASHIVVVERGRRRSGLASITQALAFEGGDASLPPITDIGDEDLVRITSLSFREPLADLGLEPGALRIAPTGVPLLELHPELVEQVVVEDGRASPWTPVTTLDGPAAALRIERIAVGCTRFRVRTTRIDPGNDASFALRISDQEAYVGLATGRLYVINRDGTVREVTPPASFLPEGTSVLPAWGGFREAPDIIWLTGEQGELWRVRTSSDGALVEIMETHRDPLRGTARWVAGTVSGDRVEIFLRTGQGAFVRFDGEQFEVVHQFEPHPAAWYGALLVRRPGEAWASNAGASYFARYRENEVQLFRPGETRGLSALDEVPGVGIIVADVAGRLYTVEDSGASTVHTDNVGFGVTAFAPAPGGFYFVGYNGGFGQFSGSSGLCPVPPAIAAQDLHLLVPLGDALLVTGDAPLAGGPLVIAILEPR